MLNKKQFYKIDNKNIDDFRIRQNSTIIYQSSCDKSESEHLHQNTISQKPVFLCFKIFYIYKIK